MGLEFFFILEGFGGGLVCFVLFLLCDGPYVRAYMWKSDSKLQDSVLTFYRENLLDRTQLVRLGAEHLYPPSCHTYLWVKTQ